MNALALPFSRRYRAAGTGVVSPVDERDGGAHAPQRRRSQAAKTAPTITTRGKPREIEGRLAWSSESAPQAQPYERVRPTGCRRRTGRLRAWRSSAPFWRPGLRGRRCGACAPPSAHRPGNYQPVPAAPVRRLNGKASAIIAIYQLPGSNALQTAEGVRKLMSRMKERLPEDVDYAISLDQTLPVTEGMRDVVETLVDWILCHSCGVPLLARLAGHLIPMLAVPVSLVGTFALFPLFGFSIKHCPMLGLVLAIGLVVDDAIVVVEGVQRHIEEGLAPKDAQ